MPYAPIPFSPAETYSNRDYTLKQIELLQQQADRESAYAQQRGALMAERWQGLGGVTTETLADLVKSRDVRVAKAEAQRRYDAEQAEDRRRYNLSERRATAQEAQQAIDRKKADDRFDYSQIMGLSPNTPLSASQLDTLARVNPGAMTPLTRERDQLVARDAPPATSTEDMFADTLRRGLTGEKRGPSAPLFGGSLETERVTDQYGVGRRRTAAEEEQLADNISRQNAAQAAARQLVITNQRATAAGQRADDNATRLAAGQLALNARFGQSQEMAERRLEVQTRQMNNMVDARSQTQFNTLTSQYTKDPIVAAADRTYVLRDTANAILAENANNANPSRQLRLAYSYVGAIDNYMSTVREGELENLGQLDTRLEQYRVELKRLGSTGGFLSPKNAKSIARDALELATILERSRQRKAREYAARANVTNPLVGGMFRDYLAEIAPVPTPPPPGVPDVRSTTDALRDKNVPLGGILGWPK